MGFQFLIHFYASVSFGADGNVFNFAAAKLFQKLYVIERGRGQIFSLSATGQIAVPAFNLFQHGFAIVENVGKRKFVDNFSVKQIMGADFDFFVSV